MTVVRVLGAFGKTVIALGLIILLFGIFQLWGTGIIEARAQQDLDDDFTDLLEASSELGPAPFVPSTAATPVAQSTPEPTPAVPVAAEPRADESDPAPATPNATSSPVPESTPEPAEVSLQPDPAWLAMLYRDPGSAIARIQIPSIGVDKTVVEGVRVGDLRKGPGHYPTTPLPGQAGNAAIAGHRTTYGAPFGEIDKVIPGDEIVVTTIQGQFTYQVLAQGEGHGHLIVAPTAVEVLDQDFADHPNRLTLTACHPRGSARQRIIVIAELVSEPAPTYPRPGLEDLPAPQLADENLDDTVDTEQTVMASPPPEPTDQAVPDPEEATPTPELAEQSAPAEEEATPIPEPTEAVMTPTSTPVPPADLPDSTPPPEEETAAADSFGEGLDGDSDGLIPAILWGLAALAIWFSALFAGHRWRKLPAYALLALPFLVVMFMAFWHIDRVLPSY